MELFRIPSAGRLSEIPLDLDGFDVERKLYTADSINNLHKMNMCCDPRELLSVQPCSPQRNGDLTVKGQTGSSQDSPKTAVQSPVVHCGRGGGEEQEGSRTRRTRLRLLSIVFVTLAVALITSLALSSYAVYLMAQTTGKMDELSSRESEQRYLAEIREWKTLILKYLEHSTGDKEK